MLRLPVLPALMVLALLAPAASPLAPPAPITITGNLPQAAFAQAAVRAGDGVYLLGGAEMACYCALDSIVRHSIPTGAVELLPFRLSAAAHPASAVWDGSQIFVFSGSFVHKLDPSTGTVLVHEFPVQAYATWAAVLHGDMAYIFQSYGGSLLLYDIPAGALWELPVRVPYEAGFGAVAWNGAVAYIVGGRGDQFSDRVWRFDPATWTFERMDVRLPFPVARGAAVWDGEAILLLGGYGPAVETGTSQLNTLVEHREILRIDPAAGTVIALPSLLPGGSFEMPAVWDGSAAHVYGGRCTCAPTWIPELEPDPDPLADPVLFGSVLSSVVSAPLTESDLVVRITP